MTQTTPTRDEAVAAPINLAAQAIAKRRDAWKPGERVAPDYLKDASAAVHAYLSAVRSAPAPASGGVDAVAFHEAFELIFEAYAGPADVHATDTAWAMSMSRKINKAFPLLQKVRASLSPAATPVSEAGGEPDWNGIARRMQRAGAPGTEEELETALRAALAQPASSPAGGDVEAAAIE